LEKILWKMGLLVRFTPSEWRVLLRVADPRAGRTASRGLLPDSKSRH